MRSLTAHADLDRPSRSNPASPRLRAAAVVVLAALGVLVAVLRLHTYHEPLERDLTTYAVVAHEMGQGRVLYADLWDHKPPALFLTYRAAEMVIGYGEGQIYALWLTATLATLGGVFAAAWGLRRRVADGLWAAACWAILASDIPLQANMPNVEVFLNGLLVAALALFLTARDARGWWWRALAIGVLCGWASAHKQIALVPLAVLMAWHVIFPPAGLTRSKALLHSVLMGVPTVVCWALITAYFWSHATWQPFYDCVFTYNAAYTGGLLKVIGRMIFAEHWFSPALVDAMPLFLAATAAVFLLGNELRGPVGLVLCYALGAFAMAVLPGKFQPHYYQLLVPALCILGGLGVEAIAGLGAGGEPRALARVGGGGGAGWRRMGIGGGLVALLVLYQVPQYRATAEESSERKYGKDQFVADRRMAQEIDQLLQPGERFFEWGAETGLYFYTHRSPPTGLFYNYPYFIAPPALAQSLAARTTAELDRDPPDLFLINCEEQWPKGTADFPDARDWATQWTLQQYATGLHGDVTGKWEHPIVRWALDRYEVAPVAPVRGRYLLLVRRNGPLAARMKAATRPG